jgi:hypothetical protein
MRGGCPGRSKRGGSRDAWCLLSLTQGDDRESHGHVPAFYRAAGVARACGQYADNHARACLIFDRQALVEAMHRNLGSKGNYYGPGAHDVAQAAGVEGRERRLLQALPRPHRRLRRPRGNAE